MSIVIKQLQKLIADVEALDIKIVATAKVLVKSGGIKGRFDVVGVDAAGYRDGSCSSIDPELIRPLVEARLRELTAERDSKLAKLEAIQKLWE